MSKYKPTWQKIKKCQIQISAVKCRYVKSFSFGCIMRMSVGWWRATRFMTFPRPPACALQPKCGMECSKDANMTRNLPGCKRLNSLSTGGRGLNNVSSGSVERSPPSKPSAVTLRRRAQYSKNQNKRAGSGQAKHSQTWLFLQFRKNPAEIEITQKLGWGTKILCMKRMGTANCQTIDLPHSQLRPPRGFVPKLGTMCLIWWTFYAMEKNVTNHDILGYPVFKHVGVNPTPRLPTSK